jgi:hypothetical protein
MAPPLALAFNEIKYKDYFICLGRRFMGALQSVPDRPGRSKIDRRPLNLQRPP